jgi:hypothetical protein
MLDAAKRRAAKLEEAIYAAQAPEPAARRPVAAARGHGFADTRILPDQKTRGAFPVKS